jgi:phosphatidylserine/phosphatidylglycerophosphate/cardiolipin synthase-like enzyme
MLALTFSAGVSAWADDAYRGGKGSDAGEPFPRIQIDKLIVMPMASSHSDWVDAIKKARKSIHMEMFHITEKAVIEALVARAHDNIDMRIVVDHQAKGGYKAALDTLTNAGVQVRLGSQAYSITHSKAMIVDGETAWITSINMTNTGTGSRDFGILTPDQKIIAEIDKVFEADWKAAADDSSVDTTPSVNHPNLAWSPTNSTNQLKKLVDSATRTLDIEVENLGADDLINAFNTAASRGVEVRLIIPQCTGNNPNNYAALKKLNGVKYHVEHDGKSLSQPYLHAKMMVVDGKRNYIGSINFSYNSTQKARELGVIFLDENIGSKLSSEFETDWNRSQVPGDKPDCGGGKDGDHTPSWLSIAI